ncbi:hypothetical protein B4U79_16570 [Dinothrombium tinctorium]|uniref:EB domain-containing protein n=1 Tax=Dinothrombium tinctorium TaxID=1965070 RepID=A0A443QIR3_9ACAR|nr:hypothetical protein B4U79_16570 [Dinothrombium tinctorium]
MVRISIVRFLFAHTIFVSSLQVMQAEVDYEQLKFGMYSYVLDKNFKIGSEFKQTCIAKIDKRDTCMQFGECPTIKFVWTLPVWLKEAQIRKLDTRVMITYAPVRILNQVDTEVYQTTLSINSLGLIHRGRYACILRLIDDRNGRSIDRKGADFELIVSGGLNNENCEYNDQCESQNSKLGGKCYFSDQCRALDPNTYCTYERTCRCKSGARCREPGFEKCISSDDCLVTDFCLDGVCRARKELGDDCDSDSECQATEKNAICGESRKCVCVQNYKRSSKNTCILAGTCLSHDDCSSAGGYCSAGELCEKGHSLGSPCSTSLQCQVQDKHSQCSRSNICECLSGFIIREKGGKNACVTKHFCMSNKECRLKSDGVCIDYVCSYLTKLGQQCKTTEECVATTNFSYCDKQSKTCECAKGFTRNNGKCEIVDCFDDIKCLNFSEDWFCSGEKCDCKVGYNLSKYGSCLEEISKPMPPKDVTNWTHIIIGIISLLCGILLIAVLVLLFSLVRKQRLAVTE